MSFALVRAVAAAEKADDLHSVRVLLLLGAVSRQQKTTIEGITKLAKMDFLLRYPTALERALIATGRPPEDARVHMHERHTIESKMIRFRYGPWDERYRRWIGLLVARKLAATYVVGRTVHVGITEEGKRVQNAIRDSGSFADQAHRSSVIADLVRPLSATALMKFIYRVFPELESLQWGEEITL